MSNVLEYKGYCGSVEYYAPTNLLFGNVLGIKSLVLYQGYSLDELIYNFKDIVEFHLEPDPDDEKYVSEPPVKVTFYTPERQRDKSDLLQYKGYYGTVEYSAEENILCGRVLDIGRLFTYHGGTLDALIENFKVSIDSLVCETRGIEPEVSDLRDLASVV